MTVLLLLFGLTMAAGTFVENDYNTATAKALIYDATWFEILMLWLIILFARNIKTYRLTRRAKWPILIFHLAFIFMFLGGAITRYTSFEAQMPIKEGETTNEMISDMTYVKLQLSDGKQTLRYDKYPYVMSHFNTKDRPWPFHRTYARNFQFGDKEISLKSIDYIPLAKDSIRKTETGKKILSVVTVGPEGRTDVYIPEGGVREIDGTRFSFENPVPGSVAFIKRYEDLTMILPEAGSWLSMEGQQKGVVTNTELLNQNTGKIQAGQPKLLNHRVLYTVNHLSYIIPESPFSGEIVYYPGDKNDPEDQNRLDVIQLEVASGQEKDTLYIKGGKGVTGLSNTIQLNGLDISLGYGSKLLYTDFYIRCDDFLVDRYPGSNNPSSYESRITVLDQGTEKQHHVYMNNVLDYRGYRFFQASYFPDESGTILSVNADRWGTNITYLGYFLLFVGMFFTLFWKGSHFGNLNRALKRMHMKNAVLFFAFIFTWISFDATSLYAQDTSFETIDTSVLPQKMPGPDAQFAGPGELGSQRIIDPDHAAKFGYLLVQDIQGRIKPVNTLALELIRKLYKKDRYNKDGHTLSAEQWFLSMQIDPGFWADEPLIKVGHKGGDQLIRESGANVDGYTSYANLVEPETGVFILEEQSIQSFSKPMSEQSNYDKAVIAVTERFNIFTNIAFGYFTRIVPVINDPAQTWRSWIYNTEENATAIDTTAYNLLTPYFDGIKEGLKSGDWRKADENRLAIDAFQQKWGKTVVPSTSKVNLEILYNRLNVFFWLMIAFSLLGILMTVLGFAEVFSSGSRSHRYFQWITKALLRMMILALVVQVVALGVRWHLSGHAPWSNGYEAIIFISGIGVLSGLLLYRNRNAFIPAAGALVAMIMMGFAHGGSMLDPQITPLEPVLKSYWLMVHVSIITSSYGFFGLSAVLSVMALLLFILPPTTKIKHSIRELSIVNELALTIGIFALTVGTFLGGMWANESWGRYWSWDPKETWAFISIIVYAVVLHLRLVPGLRSKLTFNIFSMWAIWSIMFTYFGVNYYLTGLHSYAAGDPIPVPAWIYATAVGMLILSIVAYFRNNGVAEVQ